MNKIARISGVIAILSASALALGGCATNVNPGVESVGLQAQKVALGRVIALRPISINPSNSGGAVGGVAGGLAGSTLGKTGITRALGAIAGVVGGALAGRAIGHSMTTTKGVDVTVKFRDGSLLAVAQGYQTPRLHVGERVQVLYGHGTTRVLALGGGGQ